MSYVRHVVSVATLAHVPTEQSIQRSLIMKLGIGPTFFFMLLAAAVVLPSVLAFTAPIPTGMMGARAAASSHKVWQQAHVENQAASPPSEQVLCCFLLLIVLMVAADGAGDAGDILTCWWIGWLGLVVSQLLQ